MCGLYIGTRNILILNSTSASLTWCRLIKWQDDLESQGCGPGDTLFHLRYMNDFEPVYPAFCQEINIRCLDNVLLRCSNISRGLNMFQGVTFITAE